jgi:hypothetical protein
MTKLTFALVVAIAVSAGATLFWKAEATPLTAVPDSLARFKGHSMVQKTGCVFGTSRCPACTKWSCAKSPATAGAVKKCWCRPC